MLKNVSPYTKKLNSNGSVHVISMLCMDCAYLSDPYHYPL